MKYKPEKHQFISYLYGELSEAEKRKWEDWLRENPEAGEEATQMKGVLDQLKHWPDVEAPEPPTFLIPPVTETTTSTTKEVSGKKPILGQLKRISIAVAAGIALFIVVGAATRMEVLFNQDGFRLSFGQHELPDQAGQREILAQLQQVRQELKASRPAQPLVVDHLTQQEIKELKLSLTRLENRMNTQTPPSPLKANSRIVRQPLTDEQFNQLVEQISRENFRLVQNAFEAANQEQQEQLYQALNQFAGHLDQIRAEDTQMVMASLEELDQKADRKFRETDQALDVLIQTVQSQPQK